MRRLLALLVICTCSTMLARAAEFDPFEGPTPIAIFIQTNPWLMVIGSDTPRVTVYDNGDVIFVKKVEKRLVYHRVTLDKKGLEEVRAKLKPVLALKDLKPRYDIRPNATDQPEAIFYLNDGGREVATSVYGLMAAGTELPGFTQFPGGPKPTIPPDELLKLHKWLCELDYPHGKEWTPKYVEVMLWDYPDAQASTPWPKDWPSLASERTIKRGDAYSIFLDASLLPKLRELLAANKGGGAVEIDGKKMAASYRMTFPGEGLWHKAFKAAAEREAKLEKAENKDAK
jgi:hypothetical protein